MKTTIAGLPPKEVKARVSTAVTKEANNAAPDALLPSLS
jgi:hypothetical protein